MLKIEIIYISATQETFEAECHLPDESTVQDALRVSGFLTKHPESADCPLGIFSRPAKMTTRLQDGDRIECYRLLVLDPKERRRLKTKKR